MRHGKEVHAHLTDEALLALMDGECGWLQALRGRRHLRRCWQCRGRAGELAGTIGALRHEVEQSGVSERDLMRARFRFEQQRRRIAPPAEKPGRVWLPATAAVSAVAAMLLLAAGGLRWLHVPELSSPVLQPVSLSAIAVAERDSASSVVHEEFLIDWQARPHRLSIWTSSSGNRRAVAFEDTLRGATGASSQPESAPLWEFATQHLPAQTPAGDRIAHWAMSRDMQPFSMAADFADFVSRNHAHVRMTARAGAARWDAIAPVGPRVIQVSLEAAPSPSSSLLPYLEEVAVYGRDGVWVMRVLRQRRDSYSSFREVAHAFPRTVPAPPAVPLSPGAEPEALLIPAPSPRMLVAGKVALLQALVETDMWMRVPLEIRILPDHVALNTAAIPEEQQERLSAALRLRASTAPVAFEAWPLTVPSPPEAESSTEELTGDQRAVAEEWLRARLNAVSRASQRALFERMGRLVRAAEELESSAWSLQRMLEMLPEGDLKEMDLLTALAAERLIEAEALRFRDAIARLRAESTGVVPDLEVRQREYHPEGLRDEVAAHQRQASAVAREMIALFSAGSRREAGTPPVEERIAALADGFAQLEAGARWISLVCGDRVIQAAAQQDIARSNHE